MFANSRSLWLYSHIVSIGYEWRFSCNLIGVCDQESMLRIQRSSNRDVVFNRRLGSLTQGGLLWISIIL